MAGVGVPKDNEDMMFCPRSGRLVLLLLLLLLKLFVGGKGKEYISITKTKEKGNEAELGDYDDRELFKCPSAT
jgi:hypothetical protein